MPRNLPASEPQENEDREDPNENASGSESQGIQVEGQTQKTFWEESQSQQFKGYCITWLQLEATTMFIDSNYVSYTFLEAEA